MLALQQFGVHGPAHQNSFPGSLNIASSSAPADPPASSIALAPPVRSTPTSVPPATKPPSLHQLASITDSNEEKKLDANVNDELPDILVPIKSSEVTPDLSPPAVPIESSEVTPALSPPAVPIESSEVTPALRSDIFKPPVHPRDPRSFVITDLNSYNYKTGGKPTSSASQTASFQT
ncbi:hypothetical protein PtA15_6A830 [Puccinia triticina]|uniref:Uncharacterized protein n=1 Tax=Puccinia triticina TaxID=208348 RepID=A0ABY7CLU3_9BASI|nr:uncharacterized protein PtA15_6A830 [Puccinia triticina]WAQ86198.1 hypothetical protein PtA15_6A830 [Puccinia triticina]